MSERCLTGRRPRHRGGAILLLLTFGLGAPTVAAAGFPALEKKAVALVDDLAAGRTGAVVSGFDATMRSALPAPKLQAVWRGLQEQVGPYRGREGTRTETLQGYRVVFVRCRFDRGELEAKVVYDRAAKVTGLFFVPAAPRGEAAVPAYADPARYSEREVQVAGLPGTLTAPRGEGPFPAVVLVHGSGPHDRDETIGPNKPFRDLAWGLASRGVVVVRYEKRTKVRPGDFGRGKVFGLDDEVTDDAVLALKLLRQQPEVDGARVFVVGHSLGGTLGPRILARDAKAAGLVVLAGTTRDLGGVLLEQMEYLAGLDGRVTPEEREQLEDTRAEVARIEKGPGEWVLGVPRSYWLELRAYDPVETARSLGRPVLVVHGGRDYQVTDADFRGWRDGLAGTEGVRFLRLPELNHLLIAGEGRSTPAEYQTPGAVDARVVDAIAGFVGR